MEIVELEPVGDANKARAQMGWEPRIGLENLVTLMVEILLIGSGADPATTMTDTACKRCLPRSI